MKRFYLFLPAILAIAVLVAACGGDDSEATLPPTGAAGTQATSTGGSTPGPAGSSALPPTAAGAAGSTASRPSAAGSGSGPMLPTGAAGSGTAPSSGGTAGSGAAEGPVMGPDSEPTPGETPVPTGEGEVRRAVSADFLHKTLSVVDVDKLVEGAKRSDALIGEVDLSMYSPGPLAVRVTPDGKTAVVSISAGWLGLTGTTVPAGDGTMVFVDLDTLKVKGELNTGADPMGIAITKDGTHAFVGQMSSTYMAYIDLAAMSYDMIPTGNQWNEELWIDDTGTTGILTTGTAGDAMTFSVSNGAMTTGQTRGLTGDAGGAAFFPGTLFAFVVQAPTQLTGLTGGYNVIDATDPASPQVTDEVRVTGDSRIAYPVTAVPNRKTVVYPSTDAGKLSLLEMGLDAGKAVPMQTIAVGDAETLAYGLHANAEGIVLVAVGTEHYIAVVDLNTTKSILVPWEQTDVGPLDIQYIP